MTLGIVDLSRPPPEVDVTARSVPVVAVGSPTRASEFWLENATFTVTEDDTDDRRVIRVASIDETVADLAARVGRCPQASAVCDDVLRSVDPHAPTLPGVITESLAYSTLQAGPEFARWLAERGPARVPVIADPVVAERDGNTLRVRVQSAVAAQRVFHRHARGPAGGLDRRPVGPVGGRGRA